MDCSDLPFCQNHPALRQEYYCCQCDELLCRRCMMDGHRHHDYDETEVVAERTAESLRELLEKCPQSISNAENIETQLAEYKQTLSESHTAAIEAMDAFLDGAKAAIEERRKLLSDKMNKHAVSQKWSWEQLREKVVAAHKAMQTASESVRRRVEGAVDLQSIKIDRKAVHILEASQVSVAEVSQLVSDGKVRVSLSFHLNQEFIPCVHELGKVVEKFTRDDVETEIDLFMDKQTEDQHIQNDSKPQTPHTPPFRRISSVPIFPVSQLAMKVRSQSTTMEHADTDPVEVVLCGAKNEAIYPYGIAMGDNDLIIVTDLRSNSVQVIANTGKVIDNIGKIKGTTPFKGPCAVAVGDAGNIYILEGEAKRIRKFFNGNLTEVGQKLKKEFQDPRGLAVTKQSIFVTDRAKNCIHILDLNGKLISSIGDDFLKQPTGIAVRPSGHLLVADQENSCIWEMNEDGRIIRPIGGDKGSNPGQLNLPYGVALDSQGRVIVSEKGNCRISVFSANGQFETCFGSKGFLPGQFNVPRHVCVNSSGQIVVADEQNQRIQIFEIKS